MRWIWKEMKGNEMNMKGIDMKWNETNMKGNARKWDEHERNWHEMKWNETNMKGNARKWDEREKKRKEMRWTWQEMKGDDMEIKGNETNMKGNERKRDEHEMKWREMRWAWNEIKGNEMNMQGNETNSKGPRYFYIVADTQRIEPLNLTVLLVWLIVCISYKLLSYLSLSFPSYTRKNTYYVSDSVYSQGSFFLKGFWFYPEDSKGFGSIQHIFFAPCLEQGSNML